jgi:hypothetical protein
MLNSAETNKSEVPNKSVTLENSEDKVDMNRD